MTDESLDSTTTLGQISDKTHKHKGKAMKADGKQSDEKTQKCETTSSDGHQNDESRNTDKTNDSKSSISRVPSSSSKMKTSRPIKADEYVSYDELSALKADYAKQFANYAHKIEVLEKRLSTYSGLLKKHRDWLGQVDGQTWRVHSYQSHFANYMKESGLLHNQFPKVPEPVTSYKADYYFSIYDSPTVPIAPQMYTMLSQYENDQGHVPDGIWKKEDERYDGYQESPSPDRIPYRVQQMHIKSQNNKGLEPNPLFSPNRQPDGWYSSLNAIDVQTNVDQSWDPRHHNQYDNHYRRHTSFDDVMPPVSRSYSIPQRHNQSHSTMPASYLHRLPLPFALNKFHNQIGLNASKLKQANRNTATTTTTSNDGGTAGAFNMKESRHDKTVY